MHLGFQLNPVWPCCSVFHHRYPAKGCKVHTAEECLSVPWKQPTLLGSQYKQMYFAFSTVRCCSVKCIEKIGSVFGCSVMQWVVFIPTFKKNFEINLKIKMFNYVFSERGNQMCEAEGEKNNFHENFFVSLSRIMHWKAQLQFCTTYTSNCSVFTDPSFLTEINPISC